jgi:hypothetical protein
VIAEKEKLSRSNKSSVDRMNSKQQKYMVNPNILIDKDGMM